MEAVYEEERAARDTVLERVISSARRVIVSGSWILIIVD